MPFPSDLTDSGAPISSAVREVAVVPENDALAPRSLSSPPSDVRAPTLLSVSAAARLLGYELTNNFNFPYFAANVSDFWRRWHISLSTWLRDYLYIPLGGNRGSKLFTWRNLMLTMLLGGLWHGA